MLIIGSPVQSALISRNKLFWALHTPQVAVTSEITFSSGRRRPTIGIIFFFYQSEARVGAESSSNLIALGISWQQTPKMTIDFLDGRTIKFLKPR